MRPFQNPKTFISFDNAQCHCFQTPLPEQQFFLTKNQIPKNLQAQKNKKEFPGNIKQTLVKTGVKRSLRRMGSPTRNQTVTSQRSAEIDENLSFKGSLHRQIKEMIILNNYKSPNTAFGLKKPSVNISSISFNRPYHGYNPTIKLNSPTFHQQPLQQVINPQKNTCSTYQYANLFKKVQTSKISFNFLPTATKHQLSPSLKEQLSKSRSLKDLQIPITFMSEKKLTETEKVHVKRMSEEMKIPKLERKDSKFQCSDLGITQTITKNSIINSRVNTAPEKTDIYDKIEIRETATGLKDNSEIDIKNETAKISQTTILKQNIHKSVIKTKRSILSDTNRSKIVAKKDRTKPLLSKMQDVEEIRSLADSDQDNDSDKQSVVLGRLKQYDQFKSTTIIRKNTVPVELQRSLQFIQNSNSVIMDSPSGEWNNQVQSQYNY